MPHNLQMAAASVNAALDTVTARLTSGTLRFCDGAQPVSADTPLSTQRILATLMFGSPAFAPAVAGVATAHPIGATTAVSDGTAAWARLYEADGVTVVCDMSVGTSGETVADILLGNALFLAGDTVALTSLQLVLPASGA